MHASCHVHGIVAVAVVEKIPPTMLDTSPGDQLLYPFGVSVYKINQHHEETTRRS